MLLNHFLFIFKSLQRAGTRLTLNSYTRSGGGLPGPNLLRVFYSLHRMHYYKIEIKGYALCPDCATAKDLFQVRKTNLKITDIFWVVRDVEIDPYYIDCTYHYHTPILIFLN